MCAALVGVMVMMVMMAATQMVTGVIPCRIV